MINKIDTLVELWKKPVMILESLFSVLNVFYMSNENIRNEYGLKERIGFNIFTSISELYYMENFHSDIIKYIIDPSTEIIGNRGNVSGFLRLINSKTKSLDFGNIHVERETGKIDILIYDDKNAIIIENKINNAIDQQNQLARYMKKINQKKLNLIAIVYLTLIPGKVPDTNYSPEYRKYINQVQEKIVHISAVNGKMKNDLVHSYLPDCIRQCNNETAKVYIDQYRKLLMHLGGEALMKETSKKMIEGIYESKERIGLIMDINEIWQDRANIIGEIIQDYIMEKDSQYSHHPYGNTIHKKISDEVSYAFCTDGSFGFIYSPSIQKAIPRNRKEYMSILEDDYFAKYTSNVECDDGWIFRKLNLEEYKENISIIKELMLNRMKEIEKMYKNK